jgi:hypothetical protein
MDDRAAHRRYKCRSKTSATAVGARDGNGDLEGDHLEIRFTEPCSAPPEVVYDLLADIGSHLDWGGRRQLKLFRLLRVDAPTRAARTDDEFRSEGTAFFVNRVVDRSRVTEARRPIAFELVTESSYGWLGRPDLRLMGTWVHRYEVTAGRGGCTVTYRLRRTRVVHAPFYVRAPVLSAVVHRLLAPDSSATASGACCGWPRNAPRWRSATRRVRRARPPGSGQFHRRARLARWTR